MSTPPPATEKVPLSIDGRRLWLIGAGVLAAVLVPIVLLAGLAWVEMPWDDHPVRATPEWVALPQLRATTSDGTVVRARVALDVPGTMTKNRIQRDTQQVGLLLELSVAARTRGEISTPEGMRALSGDMRERLNAYLGAERAEDGVASVAIQDLLVRPQ